MELVNANEYGLSVGILGNTTDAMKSRIVSIRKIHVKEQTVADELNAPCGGTGHLVLARFGRATASREAFTKTQWLTVRSEIADYPF